MQRSARNGFTLIELSITFVVIALLVGGVLAGQSLIRAGQLRAIITEKEQFIGAIGIFKQQYRYLPGDFPTAYNYWGASCGTDSSTVFTGCNGDGNRTIDLVTGENVKVWKHLSRAGFIKGEFNSTSGTYGGGRIAASPTDLPASKYPGGYWDVSRDLENLISGAPPADPKIQWLQIGGIVLGTDQLFNQGIALKRIDAKTIDSKTDDGKANTGDTRGDAGGDCTDVGTDYYHLSGAVSGNAEEADCSLYFVVR